MVILDNLVKQNNIVEYDYFGADDTKPGHVSFDIVKMECINVDYSSTDAESNLKRLFQKSLDGLNDMIKADKYISRYEYTWY